jgi:NADH:ubiquinone oxidoreductase subunit C
MEELLTRIKEHLGEKILRFEEKVTQRCYIDLKPHDIPDSVKFMLHDVGCRFVTATGTDTPSGIEILYHFSYDRSGHVISLRTLLANKAHPEMVSIAPLLKGAEWIEREMWELLGINFVGHPNLKHLLLIDEWPEGEYPLRKNKKK